MGILHVFYFCFLMLDASAQRMDESWLVFTSSKLKADGTQPIVVRSLSKNGTSQNVEVAVNGNPFALSYDIEMKNIYFSVQVPGKSFTQIQAIKIGGTELGKVARAGEGKNFMAGLAFDWITKNVYYADSGRWQIGICYAYNSGCKHNLVRVKNSQPFRIALHPRSWKMFWTAHGQASGVYRASMDGSNPIRIATKGAILPGGIAIDHALSRLYWVDIEVETIYTADFNGANVTPIRSIGSTRIKAWNFALSGPDIYWIDADEEAIKKCNKNDGSSFAVEQRGLGKVAMLDDMIVIHAGSQSTNQLNPCASVPCDYICVITQMSFRCLCPDGATFSQDGQKCEYPTALITSSGGTHIIPSHGDIITLGSLSSSWGLSYDLRRSQIYWAGGASGSTIFRANLDGTDVHSVVTISGGKPISGLAFDWIAENIYYTNQIDVGVCDVSNGNCSVLISDPRNSPLRIDILPRAGLMFWTTQGRVPSISRANMDGSSARRIIRGPPFDFGFVIDKEESRLFWLQQSDLIATSDFESQDLQFIRPIRKKLISLAIAGDFLYWLDNKGIQTCDKKTQTDLANLENFDEKYKYQNWNVTVFEMRIVHPEGQLEDRVNHCAGGLCSHICVLTDKYFRCICPDGMYLTDDCRKCEAVSAGVDVWSMQNKSACIFNESLTRPMAKDNGGRLRSRFSCSSWTCADKTCVEFEDVCNGVLDCNDGTDEGSDCEIPCSEVHRVDDADCIRTPNGAQVLCPPGFQLAVDGTMTCKDVDECAENICPRYCINTNGSYECRDQPEGSDQTGAALAATIPTLFAIAAIGIAAFYGLKYIQARKILRRLTPEEIREFLHGDESSAITAECGAEQAMLLPFQLIIPPDSIKIVKDAILGSGQFGVVYKGFCNNEAVAVKTFKRTVEIDEFKAVLAEAKIMAYIGHAENVVRFLGAEISGIADRKIVLVTELSPHGDLLGHLRRIKNEKLALQANDVGQDDVISRNLISWCEQIARGMQHLEAKKIVHGDLAARNILVFKENTVKISDFGMSKKLYGNSEYLMRRQKKLPWKWYALELLTKCEFSTDSDIWAFGITAWEIFSLGRHPYEDFSFGPEFLNYLEQENRLPKPTYATAGIYKILVECWNTDRSSRPRFATLKEYFREEWTNIGTHNLTSDVMAGQASYSNVKQEC